MKYPSFLFVTAIVFGACSSSNLPKKPVSMEITEDETEVVIEKPVEPKQQAPAPQFVRKGLDTIYDPMIKTVVFRLKGTDYSLPILNLNGQERLELKFDDLRGDLRNYSYIIKHHDANWEESYLNNAEYMEGFPENYIDSYTYSLNTLVPFVHYRIELPNNNVRFLRSGNYTIQVFANNDPEEVVLTQRFFVLDQKVNVIPEVKRATMVSQREEMQEVDFQIQTGDYTIDDPFSGLHVVLRQNQRWDNAVTTLKPVFIRNNTYDYNLEGPNTFYGGNEFRYVDMRSIRFLGDQIKRADTKDSVVNIHLINDPKRSFQVYSELFDINGERVINITEGNDPDREADYVWAHFTLPYSYQIDEPVYVFGALSGWKLHSDFKMSYDESSSAYRCKVLLKQGYYNYVYAIPSEGGKADIQFFEGSHYQTENQYHIFVYNRAAGERYDALVGFASMNSRNGF